MVHKISLDALDSINLDLDKPTRLWQRDKHAIYWLGITDKTAFRCNSYLIVDGEEAILVDPGNRSFFNQILSRLSQIIPPGQVTGMILCHQDPDVAASMVDWLNINPGMQVFSTPRTHVLLPHYGRCNYTQYDVEKNNHFILPSGAELVFYPAPFLHSPGAFVTYDSEAGYLFSGDIWAALDIDWKLIVTSFKDHRLKLDLFQKDYMASNLATRGFVQSLSDCDIQAILPQHGSIIGPHHIVEALDYLKKLQCGTDLIYAGLDHAFKDYSGAYDIGAWKQDDQDFDFETDGIDREIDLEGLPSSQDSGIKNDQLQEALLQAQRVAKIRDNALNALKIAETKLRVSEERTRMLLKAAGEGIFGLDKEGLVTFINPAAQLLLGFTEHEFIRGNIHKLIHHTLPDGSPYHENDCKILSSIQDGRLTRVMDEIFWRKDETPFPVEYITAPIRSEKDGKIDGVVVVFSDISDRQLMQAELEYNANYDGLTGLINRHKFNSLLKKECRRSMRYKNPLSLIMYDIDNFKKANDVHGHLEGDRVLREVKDEINRILRSEDYHCRWGGDEFIILTPDTSLKKVMVLAERCRKAVCEHGFSGIGLITISLGIIQYMPGESIDTMLKRVDDLLYLAKQNGRNRVEGE